MIGKDFRVDRNFLKKLLRGRRKTGFRWFLSAAMRLLSLTLTWGRRVVLSAIKGEAAARWDVGEILREKFRDMRKTLDVIRSDF